MSLSISTATAAVGAARLAQGIARGVSQAIGFHDALNTAQTDVQSIENELRTAIGARLSAAGIEANPSLAVRVDDQGRLQVDGDHPQAAEIEALLSDDQAITSAAKRLIAAAGPEQIISIDLTGPPAAENILTGPAPDESSLPGGPGGYPNW